MRKPNGYGSVIKLSGARRKPYAVRKQIGYSESGSSQYKYIGYYATRKEAELELAKYNANPYELKSVTFAQVWEEYHKTDMTKLTTGTQNVRRWSYSNFQPLYNVEYASIKPMQYQSIIDKLTPSNQAHARALLLAMEKFAIKNEWTTKSIVESLTTSHIEKQHDKQILSEEEIAELWKHTDEPIVRDALILIYTGFRISEYFALTTDSIKDGCFVGGGKTEAGKNRMIPIHHRILPLIEENAKMSRSGALHAYPHISNTRFYWHKNEILKGYTFHECRHTFRSRLDNAGANENCINMLMGHKGETVGRSVYTHKNFLQLKETIELLV